MKNLHILALIASVACLAAAPAHAAVTYTTAGTGVVYYDPTNPNGGYYDLEATYDGDISSTDLVEAGSSSLSGSVIYNAPDEIYYGGGINDGLATSENSPGVQAGYGPNDVYMSTNDPGSTGNTITFNLTAPYDISKIQVISGYSGGFSNQSFTVAFETTSSPDTFQDIGGNLDPTIFSNGSGFQAAETEITDTTGTIASDVTALQFTFAGAVIIRELDVFGTAASVPEPGTWALMLGGLVALLGFIRLRKTKA